MSAWLESILPATATGHHARPHVSFKVLFKAVFGFALVWVLVIGAVLGLTNVQFPVELQLVAASLGAVMGGLLAWRAGKDASTYR
jgi:hypothetical protein